MLKVVFVSCALTAALSVPASASETVLYCVVEQVVGFKKSETAWQPLYGDGSAGDRYTVRFQGDFSELTGVEGTETPYHCRASFPNKAPDVVTCTNSKVETMVFSYSKEGGNFVLSMISPGGWLGEGTQREEGKEPLTDHIVIGTCQDF